MSPPSGHRAHDPALLLVAHRALGTTLLWCGELTLAHTHLEEGITLYDPSQHRSLAFLYGEDPGVVCLFFAAFTLTCLGFPDQALQRNREALRLAREHAHLHNLARAAHPEDDGTFMQYIPQEELARIYAN